MFTHMFHFTYVNQQVGLVGEEILHTGKKWQRQLSEQVSVNYMNQEQNKKHFKIVFWQLIPYMNLN